MLLDLELQEALNMTEGLVKDLLEATALAIRLKNQALFWTHLAEWLVLTATSLTTGFVIWTLMIRKNLYREIDTTRLNKANSPA